MPIRVIIACVLAAALMATTAAPISLYTGLTVVSIFGLQAAYFILGALFMRYRYRKTSASKTATAKSIDYAGHYKVLENVPEDMRGQLRLLLDLLGQAGFRDRLRITARQYDMDLASVDRSANALRDRLPFVRRDLGYPDDTAGQQICAAYVANQLPHSLLVVARVLEHMDDNYILARMQLTSLAMELVDTDYARRGSAAGISPANVLHGTVADADC